VRSAVSVDSDTSAAAFTKRRKFKHNRLRIAAALVLTGAVSLHPSATTALDDEGVAAMEKFLGRPLTPHQYRASRRLEASGYGQTGWLEVETSFTPAGGLQYVVTAEGGSGYIRSRVLRSLLDEEQRLIARGATAGVAISRENYKFAAEGRDADGLALVSLTPLRKERSLIVGRMFLTPGHGEIVRLEGILAKNPSFWLKRVNVVRSYRRMNGVIVPVSLESRGQLRLFGRSLLTMTYHYSEVDNQPVEEDTLDSR
jgi:hypothetical protein